MPKDNKELAKEILNELVEKIDVDLFLDVFKDKYNWFGHLGLEEEAYKELSLKVNIERETNNSKPKQLIKRINKYYNH